MINLILKLVLSFFKRNSSKPSNKPVENPKVEPIIETPEVKNIEPHPIIEPEKPSEESIRKQTIFNTYWTDISNIDKIIIGAVPVIKSSNLNKYMDYLKQYSPRYDTITLDSFLRYLAQVIIESDYFKTTKEYGSKTYFAKYDGRKDLGNIYPGDGAKYAGRGLIQTTGRINYGHISEELKEDFISNPELLETPKYAVISSLFYWNSKGLYRRKINEDTAESNLAQVKADTKKVNGGYNHLKERQDVYVKLRNEIKKVYNI